MAERTMNLCAAGCALQPLGPRATSDGTTHRCGHCGRRARSARRPAVLRVAFWNRNQHYGADRTLRCIDDLNLDWDVLALVECSERVVDVLRDRFGDQAVAAFTDHRYDTERDKPHGPVVVTTDGVTIVESRPTFPWPVGTTEPKADKSLTVEVETRVGRCTVVATHIMNGGDGWERKLASYRLLEDSLSPEHQQWPVVVGMDANSSTDQLGGRIEPDEIVHDQQWFHSGWARHGLIDTFTVAVLAAPDRAARARTRIDEGRNPGGTYRRARHVERFDRIYASPDLDVVDAGICAAGFDHSDHALVWADLLLAPLDATIDPDVEPAGPRKEKPNPRERLVEDLVELVTNGYGFNRLGYLARVALASASPHGHANKAFIDEHYSGGPRPDKQWNGAKNTTNKSWNALGGGRHGDQLIHYDGERRIHWMDQELATHMLDHLGIDDLVERLEDPTLEDELRQRLDPQHETRGP